MTNRLTAFALAFLLSGSAFAADVTGKWSGSVIVKTPDGTEEQPAFLVLKQSGSALTGTAGPTADRQSEIKEAKVDGDAFEFQVTHDEALVLIKVKVDGENLKGDIVINTPDGKLTGLLNLKRIP